MNKARVLVGMSGGVDSSVAAMLLTQQGYDVHGVFIKSWEDTYDTGLCTAAEDLSDAEDVCETLDVPLHKVSFAADYRDRVFAYFLEEHRRGRTPNPDILCNKEIKFGAFIRYAARFGANFIATGHYARRELADGRERLRKGRDRAKDQSYFLHTLDQAQLTRALFPIGELGKQQVRKLAAAAGLNTYDKKDSTGICFIGERRFREFLGRYLPTRPGIIRTTDGDPVGEHCGLAFYTLGQRQGLGIGGRPDGTGAAWYVVDKNLQENVLTVAQGGNHPSLFHRRLIASQLHWIDGKPPVSSEINAKIRFRQEDQPCTINNLDGATCEVCFAQPQRSIAPGQSIVFYSGDDCLGGGVIDLAFD